MQINDEQAVTELVVKFKTNSDCISHGATIHTVVEPFPSDQGEELLPGSKGRIEASQSTVRRIESLNQDLATRNKN